MTSKDHELPDEGLGREAARVFQEQFAALLQQSEVSNQVLAKRVGVSNQHIANLRDGNATPKLPLVYDLALALGVLPSELLPLDLVWQAARVLGVRPSELLPADTPAGKQLDDLDELHRSGDAAKTIALRILTNHLNEPRAEQARETINHLVQAFDGQKPDLE